MIRTKNQSQELSKAKFFNTGRKITKICATVTQNYFFLTIFNFCFTRPKIANPILAHFNFEYCKCPIYVPAVPEWKCDVIGHIILSGMYKN